MSLPLTIIDGRRWERAWKCPHCGQIHWATDLYCDNSGGGIPEAVEWLGHEYDRPILDKAKREQADEGDALMCPACDQPNRGKARFCSQCASPLDPTRTINSSQFIESMRRREGRTRPAMTETTSDRTRPDFSEDTPSLVTSLWAQYQKYVFVGVGVLILLPLLVWFLSLFRTHEEVSEVTSATWTRTVPVLYKVYTHGEGWELPTTGEYENVHHVDRLYQYNTVVVGYNRVTQVATSWIQISPTYVPCGTVESKGGIISGVSCLQTRVAPATTIISRDVPITAPPVPDIRWYYTYDIVTWKPRQPKIAEGDHRQMPYWPTVILNDGEKEGDRSEVYLVHFKHLDDNKPVPDLNTTQANWGTFEPGQRYKLTINGFGVIVGYERIK